MSRRREQGTLELVMARPRHLVAWAGLVFLVSLPGCSSDEPPANPGKSIVSADKQPDSQPEQIEKPAPELAEAEAAFQAMSDPDPVAWEEAYEKLQQIGAPALPVLLKGLQSDSQDQRVNASSVLAAFGVEAESAAEELIAALDDESMFVRANLATALLQMPDHVDRVVPVFAEILTSENVELRPSAAMNLGLIETEKVRPYLPQLITALDDPNRKVVTLVVQLLGRLGPDAAEALPKLRQLDTSGDDELQAAVTSAILQIEPDGQPE